MNTNRTRRPRLGVKVLVAGAAAAVFLAGTAPVAQGYGYMKCSAGGGKIVHKNNQIRWGAAENGFATQNTRDALERAVAAWNRAPGNFTFLAPSYGDKYHWLGNSADEMWFTNKEKHLDGSPARAMSWRDCTGIHEVDIVYRASLSWSFSEGLQYKGAYGNSGVSDWNTTAMHEMGHSVGLKHENDEYNIMGSDQTHTHANGDTAKAYAGEDAGDGEVFLYGKRAGNVDDLGVSHWKYGGEDGEYSVHIPTKLYSLASDNVISNQAFLGQILQYNVKAGSSYNAQFTYENNGADTKNGVKVGFYISDNRLVTTNDRPIGSTTLDLPVGNVNTVKSKVTIPADLKPNTNYYLGAIIDPDDAIAEVDPFNGTFLPIRIVG